MNTLSQDGKDVSKVVVKAEHWVDQRKVVQAAPADQKAREAGRLKQRGDELAEAVEHYRRTTP